MDVKRLITDQEIENILSFIKPLKGIPPASALSIVKINKDKLRKQLKGQKVYPSILPMLAKKMERMYHTSIVEAGECVGILTAQSIGERQTQSNLNNFHKAGSSENEVDVVSKFSELLNATKKPKVPNCFIYFKHGNSSIEELRNTIGSSIVELTVKKIAKEFEICVDKEDEDWYAAFETLYNSDFRQYTDCISVTLDMDILYTYKITIKDVADSLLSEYSDMACVFSPDLIGRLDIFIETATIELPENRLAFIDQDNMREIYLEEVVQPILENVIIAGIPGIEHIFFNRDGDEWMIETQNKRSKGDGKGKEKTHLIFSAILSHPDVDMSRAISNNVWDVYNVLGIEAARQFMIDQFMEIMPGINICHTMLLVDRMTYSGTISSISRYTMRKELSGPFGKASFEETLEHFIKGGLYGQVEPTKGVSASIICGKRANIGSGLCDLKMDITALPVSSSRPRMVGDVTERY